MSDRQRELVKISRDRCPYCHDAVEAADADKLACNSCMAWHHGACWQEHGSCSACGAGDTGLVEGSSLAGAEVFADAKALRQAYGRLYHLFFALAGLLGGAGGGVLADGVGVERPSWGVLLGFVVAWVVVRAVSQRWVGARLQEALDEEALEALAQSTPLTEDLPAAGLLLGGTAFGALCGWGIAVALGAAVVAGLIYGGLAGASVGSVLAYLKSQPPTCEKKARGSCSASPASTRSKPASVEARPESLTG